MRGLLVAALLAQLAGTETAPVPAEVEWAKLLDGVQVEIGGTGNVYEYNIRKTVEENSGIYCRVEMVLLSTKDAKRTGRVGVDYLRVSCGAEPDYGKPFAAREGKPPESCGREGDEYQVGDRYFDTVSNTLFVCERAAVWTPAKPKP